ncbi:transposase [Lactobacillus paraplantarum] [Lactiplantibacillus mudanjiangensis]|uniref:transposase n=1 Tax=Lactiplantibacillus mudanjiangensis TaxID=1296538 RepID=UPI00101526CD|nr:transposase [Lactiplantibacillus mudanjiangensis]VDG32460.1 transposase [Lactobacillus paraplantarum] [Lactiplantibacillus mudanjiangensis]
MLTPQDWHHEIKEHHERAYTLVKSQPWLIPTVMIVHLIPVALTIHGFWKNRALHNQLKIEREKTKQLALAQVEHVTTKVKAPHHCPAMIHDHLCRHFKH